jgi:DNA (cytosine-5)-methyltransferase 1
MAVNYNGLWKLMIDKGVNKTFLRDNGVHPTTIAKMGKNEYVSLEALEKICTLLSCRIEDIVEFISDTEKEGGN